MLTGYILFFPVVLQKELVFIPSWAVEIAAGAPGSSEIMGPKIPFKLDDRLGYFSRSGELGLTAEIDYEAVVSDNYFINYSSLSQNLVLQNSSGEILGNIVTEGLPFLLNGRSFIISPDRLTVTEHEEGKILWSVTPGSMITSIDCNSSETLIGLMNGKVFLYNRAGEKLFSFFSTDSRYSIVYACALSDDGRYMAVVTGLYPQQLICFESRNELITVILRKDLDVPFRRNLYLDYSSDGKLLYLEAPEGLDVINSTGIPKESIRFNGIVTASELGGVSELSYLHVVNEGNSILRIFRPDVGPIAEFQLPSGGLYFNPDERCVYLGWNGIIVRYDLIEG
ncbi:MAG: hypothetical protein JEZ04_00070 [Spirochaetales bacterium]|nr:hypothetical protein [Spirochaetales bacterium]